MKWQEMTVGFYFENMTRQLIFTTNGKNLNVDGRALHMPGSIMKPICRDCDGETRAGTALRMDGGNKSMVCDVPAGRRLCQGEKQPGNKLRIQLWEEIPCELRGCGDCLATKSD